ncbi:AAA family ATPase [Humidisolicoccus flavus]|uniref:AAA family ATPase n=1 Tax=Humidisolicoccus flavus TaxID=3111414 RepID=UPI00324F3DF8
MLQTLAVQGYRSVRSLELELANVTLITGANGTGKSSVYRALRLLAECGSGNVIGALANEGGLPAARWAGPTSIPGSIRSGAPSSGDPASIRLGFADEAFGYAIDLGVPQSSANTLFALDPEIKQEHIFVGSVIRPGSMLVERKRAIARVKEGSTWNHFDCSLMSYESILDMFPGTDQAPEIARVRNALRTWRFYDSFRTDIGSPARAPQVGTRSPRLNDDGSNLAAVLQTTIENGDLWNARGTIAEALSGSTLDITEQGGRLALGLRQPGMLRSLEVHELSDGTLQFLLLVAALTAVDRPSLIVLNEPERSLHRDVLPALAELIRSAAEDSQIIVVTHAADLIRLLERQRGTLHHELVKSSGETLVRDLGALEGPPWSWPKR